MVTPPTKKKKEMEWYLLFKRGTVSKLCEGNGILLFDFSFIFLVWQRKDTVR